MTYHDGGHAAHEDETSTIFHMTRGLLGDKELALDIDRKDVVDLGAGYTLHVPEMLNTCIALETDDK